ncbi:protein FAM210A-like [Pollicipes pollicipes]|uniref:protein FAM210A-like n=1 Tax=Pollicipes pollicipes TaxID=41117 RepID=UPI001884E171|nr:protein FAM210A-like [Pollicipes pollicipes]
MLVSALVRRREEVWSIASASQRPFVTTASGWLRKTGSVPVKEDDKEEKPSIFKRFKQMYKDYWYVLVPVHLVTSAVWYGSFYYASKSGIDVAGLLESWGFSETITDKLRHSSAGHLAVAYALYKIATPARYTVTLGGTTYSIKFLSERGYIQPMPSRKDLKELYDDRREELRDRIGERRREWREKFQKQRREWHEKYHKQRKEWRERYQEGRKGGWRKK